MLKSNFHTHSTFCDGCDSVESIVQSAIEKEFKYLGFSSHSYIEGDDAWTLKKDGLKAYVNEVLRVKEKYESKITILCGIEQDLLSKEYDYNFDYVIGSMHSVIKDGQAYSIDFNISTFKNLLEVVYHDDFDSLCKDYFTQIVQVGQNCKVDVVGHFDLITKFIDELNLVLPKNYLSYAEEAIKQLVKRIKIFEINTGAMAKGYRKAPYPSKEILSIILKNAGQIMINSDCHNKNYLDYGFETATNLAKEVGFTKHVVIMENGIKEFKI